MNENSTSLLSTLGLAFASQDEISSAVSFACTIVIALTITVIRVYRLIRDRDDDKKEK